MALKDFDKLLADDVTSIFLNGEFSQDAIYQTGSEIKTVKVQFFEEPLDKLGANFYHAWSLFADMPRVIKKQDTLIVKNVKYAILDASPDEFQTGLNLYLQEV